MNYRGRLSPQRILEPRLADYPILAGDDAMFLLLLPPLFSCLLECGQVPFFSLISVLLLSFETFPGRVPGLHDSVVEYFTGKTDHANVASLFRSADGHIVSDDSWLFNPERFHRPFIYTRLLLL